jgi:hypothetical protein
VTDSPKLTVLVLQEVAKLFAKLTEEQLTDLVEGRAVVEFRTPEVVIASRAPRRAAGAKPKTALDLDEVYRDIKGMTQEDAVEEYLKERDKELSLTALKELAAKIGPPVSAKGSSKAQLRKNIAAGTGGLHNRPASVLGSAWGR